MESKNVANKLMMAIVPEPLLMEWISEDVIPRFRDGCECTKHQMTTMHLEDTVSTFFTLLLLQSIKESGIIVDTDELERELIDIFNETRRVSNRLRICLSEHQEFLRHHEYLLREAALAEKNSVEGEKSLDN